jgi:hypothetical protein
MVVMVWFLLLLLPPQQDYGFSITYLTIHMQGLAS